jgi:hypothetical protein
MMSVSAVLNMCLTGHGVQVAEAHDAEAFTCNVDGTHKLESLVVHKSAKPRCFWQRPSSQRHLLLVQQQERLGHYQKSSRTGCQAVEQGFIKTASMFRQPGLT